MESTATVVYEPCSLPSLCTLAVRCTVYSVKLVWSFLGTAPGCRHERAVGMVEPLGDPNDTRAVLLHCLLQAGQPRCFLKGALWEQQEMGGLAVLRSGEPAGRREPARMPTHHL